MTVSPRVKTDPLAVSQVYFVPSVYLDILRIHQPVVHTLAFSFRSPWEIALVDYLSFHARFFVLYFVLTY